MSVGKQTIMDFKIKKKLNLTPTKQPPLVGDVSVKFGE
jgi:hypothetical protein